MAENENENGEPSENDKALAVKLALADYFGIDPDTMVAWVGTCEYDNVVTGGPSFSSVWHARTLWDVLKILAVARRQVEQRRDQGELAEAAQALMGGEET